MVVSCEEESRLRRLDRGPLRFPGALGAFDPLRDARRSRPGSVTRVGLAMCPASSWAGPVAARLREMGYTDVVHVGGGVPAIRDAAAD